MCQILATCAMTDRQTKLLIRPLEVISSVFVQRGWDNIKASLWNAKDQGVSSLRPGETGRSPPAWSPSTDAALVLNCWKQHEDMRLRESKLNTLSV